MVSRVLLGGDELALGSGVGFLRVVVGVGVVPVQLAIVVEAGGELVGIIDVAETAGDAEAEMMLGDGFRRQQTADAHVFSIPSAMQMTGVVIGVA